MKVVLTSIKLPYIFYTTLLLFKIQKITSVIKCTCINWSKIAISYKRYWLFKIFNKKILS